MRTFTIGALIPFYCKYLCNFTQVHKTDSFSFFLRCLCLKMLFSFYDITIIYVATSTLLICFISLLQPEFFFAHQKDIADK